MSPVHRRAVVVIFACDLANQGASLGPETLLRCHLGAGIYLYLDRQGISTTIVLAAGMASKNNFPKQVQTMAKMMAQVLTTELGIPTTHILLPPPGWGTLWELKAGADHLRQVRHVVSDLETCTLHLVTSDYHVRRVGFIARNILEVEAEYHTIRGSAANKYIEWLKYPLFVLKTILSSIRP